MGIVSIDLMEQIFHAVGELATSYLEVPWDRTTLEYLETNPTRNLLMLWEYIHHLVMGAQTNSGESALSHGSMSPTGYIGPPQARLQSQCSTPTELQEKYQMRSISVYNLQR